MENHDEGTSSALARDRGSSWLGLTGKKALVLGAGGLGAAIAQSLCDNGANVVLLDRSSERLGELTGQGGEGRGAGITGLVADIGTGDQARSAVAEAVGMLGGIDLFVHAVGVNDRRPILELDDDDWDRLMGANLSTVYWTAQEAGRRMRDLGNGGRMVFISSVSGLLAHPNHSIYAASKGGMNQLMRVMAREWAADGIEVNAIAPGYVDTPLTRHHLDKGNVREQLVSQVPVGRLGVPEEVANAATFLLSARADFITGQILYVDGGRTLV